MLTMIRHCVKCRTSTPAVSLFWGDIFRPFAVETWMSGRSDVSDFSARGHEIQEGEIDVPHHNSKVLCRFGDGHDRD